MEDWRNNMIKQTQQKSDRNEIFVVLNAWTSMWKRIIWFLVWMQCNSISQHLIRNCVNALVMCFHLVKSLLLFYCYCSRNSFDVLPLNDAGIEHAVSMPRRKIKSEKKKWKKYTHVKEKNQQQTKKYVLNWSELYKMHQRYYEQWWV